MSSHNKDSVALSGHPAVVLAESMSNPSSTVSSRSTSPYAVSTSAPLQIPYAAAAAVLAPPTAMAQHQSLTTTTQTPLQVQQPMPPMQCLPQHLTSTAQLTTLAEEKKDCNDESAAKALKDMGSSYSSSSFASVVSPNDGKHAVSEVSVNLGTLSAETSIIKHPAANDVILEDNSVSANRPTYWNNTVFVEMLTSHSESFSLAPLSTQALIVQAIAAQFQTQHKGRFLERHGQGWREITGQPLFLGIARALFHQVQVSKQHHQLRQQQQQQQHFATSRFASSFASGLSMAASCAIDNADRNSILNLYMAPTWSSETMSAPTVPNHQVHKNNYQVRNAMTVSPPTTSRVVKVCLPLAAHAASTLPTVSLPGSHKKVKATKKKRQAKAKTSAPTVLIRNNNNKSAAGATAHKSDGTFAHKATSSKDAKSSSSNKKTTTGKDLLAEFEDQTDDFDPATVFSKFGSFEAMQEYAMAMLPTLKVDGIPRGVTIRPSGKWQAQFYFGSQSRYIGVFDGSHAAALAYECVHRLLSKFRGRKMVDMVHKKDVSRGLFDNARKATMQAMGSMEHEFRLQNFG